MEPALKKNKQPEKEDAWHQLASKTTVKELCDRKQRELVVMSEKLPLMGALRLLSANNILSAPVIEELTGKFLGFVDVLDIAGYTVAYYEEDPTLFDDPHFIRNAFFQEEISNVLNFSRCDPTVLIDESKSVQDLIDLFCDKKYRGRLHRVAVYKHSEDPKKDKDVVNVASLSDILSFAAENVEKLPKHMANKTLEQLRIVRSIIGVKLDCAVVDALEVLCRNKISGIALIDHAGRVSANLSASDLRGLNEDSFRYFTGSTLQFFAKGLAKPPETKGTGEQRTPGRGPVSCTCDDTLGESLQTITKEKVHRLFVVDKVEEQHIYGLVSASDLVRVLQ